MHFRSGHMMTLQLMMVLGPVAMAWLYLENPPCPDGMFSVDKVRPMELAIQASNAEMQFTASCWGKAYMIYNAKTEESKIVSLELTIQAAVIDPLPADLCSRLPLLQTLYLNFKPSLYTGFDDIYCHNLNTM